MTPADHISLSMSRKCGTEGPSYDPYSYEEHFIDFSRRVRSKTGTTMIGGHITLHNGLGEWVKIDLETERRDQCGFYRTSHDEEKFPLAPDCFDELVEGLTTYTFTQIRRFYRKMEEAKRREHRGHGPSEWMNGFPGESMEICPCGAVLDSNFDESAII